ncbi:MAG: M23 family metallopeptidase [Solirubrobacteraceae bacterium]
MGCALALFACAAIAACARATAALALAGEPGGVAAPVGSESGGSPFGVPARLARPVVDRLNVPASSIAGPPPKVTLRVTEQGASTVYVRVRIVDLATRRTLFTAEMGWVHTGRTLAVGWPAAARLPAGSYRVTVGVHDHHTQNILRGAHTSGAATLAVTAPVPAKPVTPAPSESTPTEPGEPGVPTPAQTAALHAVFPVQAAPHSFGGPENRFGAPRAGHIHQGQDILAAEGSPDVAPLSGTIVTAKDQPEGAGYYVVEHTAVGFDFMFAHCKAGSFTVSSGDTVSAGRQLCLAGQTGDATAPHLHFEMWVGGWLAPGGHPIDPLPYLEAWEHDGAS